VGGWNWNGWGVRCVTDWMLGSIVFLGRFVGWLLVIESLRSGLWVGFGYCGVR